ncbi:MAG: bifunctional phosphoribosyl-AMP cyclohydrolase/phosphoribosyl-ATP diphosphatase HisIE [Acidaminobacteraceae bacterium]
MEKLIAANVVYDDRGLLPTIIQDFDTREVLMLGYMNEESLKLTLESDTVWFYSRSRQELWNKGATSGDYLYTQDIYLDCDNDTILITAKPAGNTCHKGTKTCFNEVTFGGLGELANLSSTIKDRKENPIEGSYTNYLFDKGLDKILKKVGEEASEVIIASKNSDTPELIGEISDLLYHLMVLTNEKNLDLSLIDAELKKRSSK